MKSRFTDYEHFHREVLRGKSGPLASAAEEIADDIYHQEVVEEFDSLWDSYDDEE